ncbi:NAD(+) synthase [uncultured Desulfobacter sp.]|uniref:NAD(+) synthase n=1 Tax=uncultured Desulfobacter sp. TaxID=240139 RepID=UPI002AABDCA0|nr:NAD(+) synthase [uncultured Desulfobacter sp.]
MNAEKVAAHIINWLKDYLQLSGLKGFTVGVSGGIDSAVTSTLCARTGHPVIVLNMPIHQASDQVSRSSEHIAWLCETHDNVTGHDVNLTPVFEQVKTTLPPDIQDGLTMANTRARLRMTTLYAFASHHRMLVAGTGNKVEDFGVGFYTKYGDGGVDISPIADLMKTQVYALGRYLGVSQDILSARPTDGLWDDNRTDESQIGASYEELEWAMAYEAGDKSQAITDHQKQILGVYKKFNRANRHKMEPIPVCTIPEELKA